MKENELALERGIKGEIAEDFISGLKKLFEDHYIDVPDEKYNVLEDQSSKIDELNKKLNESIEKNVELSKENGEHKRQNISKHSTTVGYWPPFKGSKGFRKPLHIASPRLVSSLT